MHFRFIKSKTELPESTQQVEITLLKIMEEEVSRLLKQKYLKEILEGERIELNAEKVQYKFVLDNKAADFFKEKVIETFHRKYGTPSQN